MSFNIGLTGIRAADSDLRTTGNNIANASTTGFKRSRAEFGDVYASSIVGTSSNATGSGVGLTDVAQQFTQGNISFTDNALDLAINGSGFFVVSDNGDLAYTRAGMFSTDNQGFVVNNSGYNLQGYAADEGGNIIDGVLTDLQIQSGNQAPQATREVESTLNLDATEIAPVELQYTADGSGVAVVAATAASAPLATPPDNSYSPGQIDIVSVTGTTTLDLSVTPGANATARQIAETLNTADQLQNLGISANAVTRARINVTGGTLSTGDITLSLKAAEGAGFSSSVSLALSGSGTVQEQIAAAINASGISGLTASVSGATGENVDIIAQNGEDIIIENVDTDADADGTPAQLTFVGLVSSSGNLSEVGAPAAVNDGDSAIVGGTLDITVEDGVVVTDNISDATKLSNVWDVLNGNSSNTFDPQDPDTYNSATSVTIYDSLGNAHAMTQYFVKERTDPTNVSGTSNTWTMYVLIDGKNVGNPPAGSSEPGLAQYSLRFSSDGTLVPGENGPFLISNWVPIDEAGNYNGALMPNNGGTLPIPNPPISSNFELDMFGTTQFGSDFAVNDMQQDGFTTGRLSGLSIDETGIIFARFTNGQAQTLGQVALAGFVNEQGMQPLGDTAWAETFESGTALIGTPQTAALGSIQSGALEESNVDLSVELVNLIVAQRNYQSNAKTIETADQVTQTILNI